MEGNDTVRFRVRLDKTLLRKLEYIAAFDGRSRNEECELMIFEWIKAFEESEGQIEPRSDVVALEKK